MGNAYSTDKIAFHGDRLDDMRAGRQAVPINIQLVPSDFCNHDCSYCLVGDTLIATPSGYKRIDEIKEGEIVFGPDGEEASTGPLSVRRVESLVEIIVGGRKLVASPEHPILTQDGWKKAGDVRMGDAAVVRVRMREARRPASWHVEYLHRPSPAAAIDVGGGEEACFRAYETRQPYEAPRSRSKGFQEGEGQTATLDGGAQKELCRSSAEANAFRCQPDERPGEIPSGHDQDTVALDQQERAALQRVGCGERDRSGPFWRWESLDWPAESRFSRSFTEEGYRSDHEGMFHREAEASDGCRIWDGHDSSLREQGLGLSGSVQERLPPADTRGIVVSAPRLYIGGIELERGLELQPIDSVRVIVGDEIVYNFACSPHEAYEANGFIVHNCAYRSSNGLSVQQFGGLDKKGNPTHNPIRMIPAGKLREIVDDAADMGVKSITWTGGGEPTAHPDHLEMFERALDRDIECSLNTNGQILRDGWKDILPRFTYVRFSFDGSDEEEYSAIRRTRPDVFHKVLGNIRSVVDEVRQRGSSCVVGAGYVVTPQFHASTAKAVRLLRDTGVAYVRLASMQSTEDTAAYGDGLPAARESVRAALELRSPSFDVFDQFDAALGKRMSDSFCGFQQVVIYIGGNQKVYRCCYVAYSGEGETGDLSAMSLKDWFASDEKKRALADFDARTCRSCPLVKKNEAISALLTPPTHVNFL